MKKINIYYIIKCKSIPKYIIANDRKKAVTKLIQLERKHFETCYKKWTEDSFKDYKLYWSWSIVKCKGE